MSKRAILLLALVAASLAAYIFAFERGSVTSKELSERSGRVLSDFVRDKVDQVVVERKGTKVVLARVREERGELGGWQMREPMLAPADTDAIDPLLGELEWLSARRTLDGLSSEDEQRFGLDAPRFRVGYRVGGTLRTLLIGGEDVHGEGVYARVEGDSRAFVVPKSVLEPLDHEPGHFRDKQLFPKLTAAWGRKLTIVRGGERIDIEKQGDRFMLLGDPPRYADLARTRELIELISELRAARYLDEGAQAAAEAALAAPTLRVEVRTQPDVHREDQQAELYVLLASGPCGQHSDERYVRIGTGPVACVKAGDLAPFDVEASALREPRLFVTEPSAIKRFELAEGTTKQALARVGDKWKAEGGGPSDAEAVATFLAALAKARATAFEPLAPFEPRGTLTLERVEGGRERIAYGSSSSAGELLVRRGDEQQLVRFPGGVADRLRPEPRRFAKLEVWPEAQPSQVVSVEARAGTLARSLERDGAHWEVESGAPVDDDARVGEIVRVLVDLEAIEYVTAKPRPAHGVAEPASRVRLRLSSGKTLALAIGAGTERGAFAQVDGAVVYEVSPTIVRLVTELAGGARAQPPASPLDDDEHEDDEHDHHGHGEAEHDHAH